MSDINFEALLAQHNKDYKEAKEYSDWMPDDGDYVILVKLCEHGAKEQEDGTMLWWRHTATVVAGDGWESIQDKEFTSLRASSYNYGMAKTNAKILNGGVAPSSSADLDRVFMGAQGKLIKASIRTSVSKKNGQEYTNCYYKELVDDKASAESVPTEVPVEEPAPPLPQ